MFQENNHTADTFQANNHLGVSYEMFSTYCCPINKADILFMKCSDKATAFSAKEKNYKRAKKKEPKDPLMFFFSHHQHLSSVIPK